MKIIDKINHKVYRGYIPVNSTVKAILNGTYLKKKDEVILHQKTYLLYIKYPTNNIHEIELIDIKDINQLISAIAVSYNRLLNDTKMHSKELTIVNLQLFDENKIIPQLNF